jgi:hypothetical protein
MYMKKEWTMPTLDELSINLTANGSSPNEDHDADWQQREDGTWWRPGGSL